MPLTNYGVLKGKVTDRMMATSQNEHFQVLIVAKAEKHRIAINVMSKLSPPEVLFYMDDNFKHEFIDRIVAQNLPEGFTKLPSNPGSLAIDFIRRNLFPAKDMKPIPYNLPGADNDLNEKLDYYIQKAMLDPAAYVFAFGQKWGPDAQSDPYFHFSPGSGIHDIHMNQGNYGTYMSDNGVYQDGCLFIQLPSLNRWVAIFIAFQVQSFHTSDQTGNSLDAKPKPPFDQPETKTPVSIIAAMVHPKVDTAGNNFVMLVNKGKTPVDLSGWQIMDTTKTQKDVIGDIILPPWDTINIKLTGHGARLNKNGGIITLLNREGIKISGVSYTSDDAILEDVLIVFG
jgi:uncharacterized protein YukJ